MEACASFRLMVSGSAALPTPLATKWKDISGHRLLERYGMTETGMILGQSFKDVSKRVLGHVGWPFSGVQVRLVDDEDQVIVPETGKEGHLQVRGPQVFKSYWNRLQATQEAFTVDGW